MNTGSFPSTTTIPPKPPKKRTNTAITGGGNHPNGAKRMKMTYAEAAKKKGEVKKREVVLVREAFEKREMHSEETHAESPRCKLIIRGGSGRSFHSFLKSLSGRSLEHGVLFRALGSYSQRTNESYTVGRYSEKDAYELKNACREALEQLKTIKDPPLREETMGYYMFKAKLLSKVGMHREYVELNINILRHLKHLVFHKKSTTYTKVDIERVQHKIFRHKRLQWGPMESRRINLGGNYAAVSFLERVIYAERGCHLEIRGILNQLDSHSSRLIQLVLQINALETTRNPAFSIFMYKEYSPHYGLPSSNLGLFNGKNTIISRLQLDTLVHEMMHNVIRQIFHGVSGNLVEKSRDRLYGLVAECVRNYWVTYGTDKPESVKAPSVVQIKKAMLGNDKERGGVLGSFFGGVLRSTLSNILYAMSYRQNKHAEEIVVRFVEMVAKYPQVEDDEIFKPLMDFVNEEIKPLMLKAFREHPNKELLLWRGILNADSERKGEVYEVALGSTEDFRKFRILLEQARSRGRGLPKMKIVVDGDFISNLDHRGQSMVGSILGQRRKNYGDYVVLQYGRNLLRMHQPKWASEVRIR